MGLFGSKKSDEQQHDATLGSSVESLATDAATSNKNGDHGSTMVGPHESSRSAIAPGDYGISDAVQLMRSLPQDNTDLVVRVVAATLESAKVNVRHVIDDATRAQKHLESTISTLNEEIKSYETEISSRKEKIQRFEEELQETNQVKERLVQAERTRSAKVGPVPKPSNGKHPSPASSASLRLGPPRPPTV